MSENSPSQPGGLDKMREGLLEIARTPFKSRTHAPDFHMPVPDFSTRGLGALGGAPTSLGRMSHEKPLKVTQEQSDRLRPYTAEDIRDAQHHAEALRAWSREESKGATTVSDRDIVRIMREAASKEAEEKGATNEVAVVADRTSKILAILAGLDPEIDEIPSEEMHFPF